MSTDAKSSTKGYHHQSTLDVGALWNIIREEVNTNRTPTSNKRTTENQTNPMYHRRNEAVNTDSSPTMVFSVVGDSDSFVPRPWSQTAFQTALIEAARSGGETWILFRKNNEVVSNVIHEAYRHYEAMEFGENKKSIGDPHRHTKLINIAGEKIHQPSNETSENMNANTQSSECMQAVYEINFGEDEDKLLEFEKYISKQNTSFLSQKMNIKMPVPIAILVCEGDLKTIVHIAKALGENIPVIIMKGSGKAADLVLDYIDKNDGISKKASISFGIQFDDDKYRILQENLREIMKHRDRVGVFDLDQDDPMTLSMVVGETVVSCWSRKHVSAAAFNADNQNAEEEIQRPSSAIFPEHGRTTKGSSVTSKKIVKKSVSPDNNSLREKFDGFIRESRPYVLNPEFFTPTSLPLYFYFVYQLLQESNRLEKCGPILLLEALKANRCDYVRVLLAKGVRFWKADLPELYGQTVACEGCWDGAPCLHIEWILKQWEEVATNNMCHTYSYLRSLKNKRGKWEYLISPDTVVADAAEVLCCTILGYEKCYRCGVKDQSTILDVLLWTIFANRKELAEICWLRSENHLLTGLVCSAILKKLAKKASNVKKHILSIDLEEHSKTFEKRCIALMNSMYNENTEYAIDLMDDEAHVWGIHSSPLAFAYENCMYDVVAHTCSQENLNKLWYNKLPPDLKPFLMSAITKPKQFCTAPMIKYIFNYMLFFTMLVVYSAFVLTSISTTYYVQDISRFYEYYVYFWGAGDLIAELISCFGYMEDKGRSQRSYYRRMKKYLYDFWNVDLLSYVLLISAVFVRHFHIDETFSHARHLFSLSVLVMYVRFLKVFLIHRKIGPTLIMIKEMLKGLLNILLIAIFVVLGVGIYYHANLWPDHQTIWKGQWTNWRIWTIIYYPYWQLNGELNLDHLEGHGEGLCTNITAEWESDTSRERCPQEDWTVQAVAAFYLLFSNLLLVNLIIAMFSSTYDRVQENSEKLWCFERYTVINDYKWRIPSPLNLFFLPSQLVCRRENEKVNCGCCGEDKKKEGGKEKCRKNFQRIIALRNHTKIK